MILKGKHAVFLGDSITEGVGVADPQNCYHQVLGKKAGLASVYVNGIGGTRIAHQREASWYPRHDLNMCARAYDLPRDADLIVVYGGTNDYIHGDAPIGTYDDTTPATFIGAVNFLMQYLTENYKNARVVFLTPARFLWEGTSSDVPSKNPDKRDNALPLPAYVEIIEACGKKHGIPVLNLYKTLPIDPMDEKQRNEFTADGLHFNDKGHAILADLLLAFLGTLDD